MWISNRAVSRPVTTTMVMLILILLGMVGYNRLKIEEFPDIDLPALTISTDYPNAAPQVIEQKITKVIERSVHNLGGIKEIHSISATGTSQIIILFNLGTNIHEMAADVRELINQIESQLPDQAQSPAVSRINIQQPEIMTLALSSHSLDYDALSLLADNVIKPDLESESGVAMVHEIGSRQRVLNVMLNPEKLLVHHINPQQIIQTLTEETQLWPAGTIYQGLQQTSLVLANPLTTPLAFSHLVLNYHQGEVVHLGDVAEVVDTFLPPSTTSIVDGRQAITFNIQKNSDANMMEVIHTLRKKLLLIKKELPKDVELITLFDGGTSIDRAFSELKHNILDGSIFTMIVVLLFLGSFSSAIIIGLALPISILACFIAVHLMGFTLNVMTLLGLSISVGLLIDDAIVVRENIIQCLEKGMHVVAASLQGTQEIAQAVVATTLAVIAVFLPIAFMQDIIGLFFQGFALTICAALLISLLVSFSLDPMLSAKWTFIQRPPNRYTIALKNFTHRWQSKLQLQYQRGLKWCLIHYRITCATVFVVGFVGWILFSFLPVEMQPRSDYSNFILSVYTDPTATQAYTSQKLIEIENTLHAIPEITYATGFINSSLTGAAQNEINIRVLLQPVKQRKRTVWQIAEEAQQLLSAIAGISTNIQLPGQNNSQASNLTLYLTGPALLELERKANLLQKTISTWPEVSAVENSMSNQIPSQYLRIRQNLAHMMQIDTDTVNNWIEPWLSGEDAGDWEATDGYSYNVVVSGPTFPSWSDFYRLTIPITQYGAGVPIKSLVKITQQQTPASISRFNLRREVDLSLEINNGQLKRVINQLQTLLDQQYWAPGYRYQLGGDNQNLKTSIQTGLQTFGLSLILLYMILASLFESFVLPWFVILSAIFAAVGALLALIITGSSLNIFSGIGLIMLAGLVAKNGILLIDCLHRGLAEKTDQAIPIQLEGAVLRKPFETDATHPPQDERSEQSYKSSVFNDDTLQEIILRQASLRLRPILMTSVAMIVGMIPITLSAVEGGNTLKPMAYTIIGGLFSATLLSLFAVPTAFYWSKRKD